MSEEWFDVAYINFDEAILHGRMTEGMDEFRVWRERDVRQVLTDDQKRSIEEMNMTHQSAMQKLLRSFVA